MTVKIITKGSTTFHATCLDCGTVFSYESTACICFEFAAR